MKFFLDMFSEASGRPSSMRLIVLLVVMFLLVPYAAITIRKGDYMPFPAENGGLIVMALGVKGWQRKVENGDSGDTARITK